jgi:hypothetical protein
MLVVNGVLRRHKYSSKKKLRVEFLERIISVFRAKQGEFYSNSSTLKAKDSMQLQPNKTPIININNQFRDPNAASK